MAVQLNPYATTSRSVFETLDDKFSQIRINGSIVPSAPLIHWADMSFNLKNNPSVAFKLSETVRWQIYFAAFAYKDPTGNCNLGSINGGEFYPHGLSAEDAVVLYRVLQSYHFQYEKSALGDRAVFDRHLAVLEKRFQSSEEYKRLVIDALEKQGDPTLNELISRLKGNPQPATLIQKQVISDSSFSVRVVIGTVEIEIAASDLFRINAEAIVNPANMWLMAGSGVCGEIYRRGGESIFAECLEYLKQHGTFVPSEKKYFVVEGSAMITNGGNLTARKVVHAVGPFWKNTTAEAAEEDKRRLYNTYYNSLKRGMENNVSSIAFPSISTGAFKFPIDLAAPVAMQAFVDFAQQHQNSSVKRIVLALGSNASAFSCYRNGLLAK